MRKYSRWGRGSMTVVLGSVESAMLVLKTWSVVGERGSRIEFMKVKVSGEVGRVKGAILCRAWVSV